MKTFDNYDDAKVHLEERRKEALADIEKKGWKVLEDRSFVGRYFPDDSKWTTYLLITTDEMIKDLMNFKSGLDDN